MAGKIKQTVETEFKTKGAKKVVKETEQIGKAQTRLGQTSASAGRQFSAQSAGMGGLVATYAGAAANVFALQQAFAALSSAAQFQQLIAGTNTLAAVVGANGEKVINTIREITNSQLTLAEASRSANIALSAGFNLKQIEGLSSVSLKASRALGRDLNDAFTRLVRGTSKLEPELLDELGIFTRLAPATEAYAAKIGKSASQLTEFERRQAFVNSAIEEGERKFGDVNVSIPTTAEKFEQLSASVIDLATQIGSFIAEKLVPLADFFTNNIGARITLFAILLKQVGSVGFKLFGAQAGAALSAVGLGAEAALGRIARIGPNIEKQREKLSGLGEGLGGKDFSLSRLSKKSRETISPLVKEAREKKLGVIGAVQLKKALDDERTSLVKTRKELLKKQKAAKDAGKSLKGLTKDLESNKVALAQVRRAARRAKVELQGMSTIGAKLVPIVGTLNTGFAKLGRGLAKVARGFNVVAIATGALLAGGSSFAELLGKTNELNEFLARSGNLLEGLFGAGVADKSKETIKSVTAAIVNQTTALKELRGLQIVKDTTGSGLDLLLAPFQSDIVTTLDINDLSKQLQETTVAAIDSVSKGEDLNSAISAARGVIFERLFGSRTEDFSSEEKSLRASITKILKNAIERSSDDPNLNLIAAISKDTGKGAKAIQDAVEDAGSRINIRGLGGLTNILDLSKQGELTKEIAGTQIRLNSLQKDFNNGTVSNIQAQQAVQTISEKIIKIEETKYKLSNQLSESDKRAIDDALEVLRINLSIVEARKEQTIAINQELKALKQLFSSEVKRAQSNQFYVNSEGKALTDQKDLRLAALSRAKELFDAGKKQFAMMKKNNALYQDLSKEDKNAAIAAMDAEQILTGARLKTAEAAKKVNKEIEKQENSAKNAIRIKTLQNELKLLQQQVQITKSIISLQKSQNELAKQRTQQAREAIDAMREMNRFMNDQGDRDLQTILGSQAGALFSRGERDQIAIKLEQKSLDRFVADQKELQARAREDQKTQLENLAEEKRDRAELRKKEDEVFAKQKEIASTQAQIANENANREVALMQKRFQAISEESNMLDNFVKNLARVLASAEIGREVGSKGMTVEQRRQAVEKRTQELLPAAGGLSPLVDMSKLKTLTIELNKLRTEEAAIDQSAAIALNTSIQRKIEDNELTKQEEEIRQKLANTTAKSKLAIEEATDAFDQLTKAAAINANKGLRVAIAGLESFAENAKTSLNSMFTAIREGTLTVENFKEGFKDFIFNIVDDIQASITEEFIVKPLKESLAGGVKDLFGIGGETKGADNATVTGGNLHVVEKGGSGVVASAVGELEEAGKTSVQTAKSTAFSFSDMFNKMKASTNPLISIFGSLGSAVTQAIGGLGKFASSLLQGITGVGGNGAASGFGSALVQGAGSLFGQAGVDLFTVGSSLGSPFSTPFSSIANAPNVFASGGRVRHMAAGGMQRDRVPAMLEPGEFVMKRSSVNRIGAGNLASMNAGSSSGAPNIEVVVNNEGSPKDASANVKPQVDVNKMVVEIVTRDIRNNGPIRKSLRTGAE